jgi:integrase
MRAKHALSDRSVRALIKRGERRRHSDGGGLYLQVNGADRGAWVFIFKRGGRQGQQRVIGLGSARHGHVALKEARALADACRAAVRQGRDPRTARASHGELSFDAAARKLIASMAPRWRSAKHRAQWHVTLLGEMPPDATGQVKKTKAADYCAAIRAKPVSGLTTEDALRVLTPLWKTRRETANRLRGRCEAVWNYARARGHCPGKNPGDNPFLWRGHLDQALPKRQRLTQDHHKALRFRELPAFMPKLRAMPGMAPLALQFLILTAARTGEVLGATWDEIDFTEKLWTVPATRMKGGREHRVPLSDRAMEILEELHQAHTSAFVFPGLKRGAPLSHTALEAVLRRMQVDVTVHGFRSSFRDWAGDHTAFARDVVEAALAHAIEDKTEAAYRRSDALDKRRKLMEAWAAYCNSAPKQAQGNVTPLRRV